MVRVMASWPKTLALKWDFALASLGRAGEGGLF